VVKALGLHTGYRRAAFLLVVAIILVITFESCGGGGGGSPLLGEVRSSNAPAKTTISIDGSNGSGGAVSSSSNYTLTGRTTVGKDLNNLSYSCFGLNCSVPSDSCRTCRPGTRVTWRNTKTGQQGEAVSWLVKGSCPAGGLFGCGIYTRWRADICLGSGKNEIKVEASGAGGKARDSLTVSFNGNSGATLPSKPEIWQILPKPQQVTIQWSENPPEEDVAFYTIYQAKSLWSAWSDDLPGTRVWEEVGCCSYTIENLVDGVTYWFAVSATNCKGEGEMSAPESAMPDVVPTSISFIQVSDEWKVGDSNLLEVVVHGDVDNPIPDLVIDWIISEESNATIEPEKMPTDQFGIARARVTALAPVKVEVTAKVTGTDISRTVTTTVSVPAAESASPAQLDE
jgi:hypothetical protein